MQCYLSEIQIIVPYWVNMNKQRTQASTENCFNPKCIPKHQKQKLLHSMHVLTHKACVVFSEISPLCQTDAQRKMRQGENQEGNTKENSQKFTKQATHQEEKTSTPIRTHCHAEHNTGTKSHVHTD